LARYLGIGEETTFGTPVSPAEYIDIVSESISADRATIFPETVRRGPYFARPGGYVPSGDIELFASANSIARFLKWAYGKVTTTVDDAVSPVAYKHEYIIDKALKSFTAEIAPDVGGSARQLAGCAVSSLAMEAVARELLAVTVSVVCAKEAKITETTPTFDTLEPFVFHEGVASIAGSTNNKVEAFRSTVENTIPDDDFVLGDQFRPRLHVLGVSITGSLSMSFEDWDEVERFYGGPGKTSPQSNVGEAALKLEFTGPDTGSTVAGYEKYKLILEIPKASYRTTSFNVDRRERIVQEIEWTALFDSGISSWIKATVINKMSTI